MKHWIELSTEQWTKLEALAAWRTELSKGKEHFTPERCVADLIDVAQTGPSGWKHPAESAK